jgi:hypothetical protein
MPSNKSACWCRIQSGVEVQACDQVLGNKVILGSVVQDESSQLMLKLTIMCEQKYIRDIEFISGHQDQRRVHFNRIIDLDLCKNIMKYINTHKRRDAAKVKLHFINNK